MSVALIIIIFIAVLFVAVYLHELGHFLTARRAGVKVEEFGIGLPPRLLGIKRGETIYSVNAVPLGAFVRTSQPPSVTSTVSPAVTPNSPILRSDVLQ